MLYCWLWRIAEVLWNQKKRQGTRRSEKEWMSLMSQRPQLLFSFLQTLFFSLVSKFIKPSYTKLLLSLHRRFNVHTASCAAYFGCNQLLSHLNSASGSAWTHQRKTTIAKPISMGFLHLSLSHHVIVNNKVFGVFFGGNTVWWAILSSLFTAAQISIVIQPKQLF